MQAVIPNSDNTAGLESWLECQKCVRTVGCRSWYGRTPLHSPSFRFLLFHALSLKNQQFRVNCLCLYPRTPRGLNKYCREPDGFAGTNDKPRSMKTRLVCSQFGHDSCHKDRPQSHSMGISNSIPRLVI